MDGVKTGIRELLDRSTRNNAAAEQAAASPDGDSEYSAYAHGRISRQVQQTVMFRWADGSMRAFAYSFFYGAEANDPDMGFILDFTQHKVKVQGRNLAPLFRLLCQHRVAEVREAERQHNFNVSTDAPVVERLEILSGEPQR